MPLPYLSLKIQNCVSLFASMPSQNQNYWIVLDTAQMEQQIQRRVIDMMRQNQDRFSNETGVEPSLSEDEVKEYLHEVIEEVRSEKTQKGDK